MCTPPRTLLKGCSGLVKWGVRAVTGQRDCARGGSSVAEALGGTRTNGYLGAPVVVTIAAIAADVVKGPVLFLEIRVALAAVRVREKEEGERWARGGKAAAGRVRARTKLCALLSF